MFEVGKILRWRSALWLLFPLALLLITIFITRSAGSRISPVPRPATVTRTEPNLAADMDHDGLPAKRWRPLPNNSNFPGVYRLKILTQQVSPEE